MAACWSQAEVLGEALEAIVSWVQVFLETGKDPIPLGPFLQDSSPTLNCSYSSM